MVRVYLAVLLGSFWLLGSIGLLGLIWCMTVAAGAGDLLQVYGANVKWSPPVDGGPTIVSYAVLSGPRALSKRNGLLSANNCGAMQGLTDAVALSADVSSQTVLDELQQAFAAWEHVANIKFVESADVDRANIIIGATRVPKGKAFANLSLRHDGYGSAIASALGDDRQTAIIASERGVTKRVEEIDKAYVCLNANAQWKRGFDGNLDVYDLRHTFMHEIGHAIGLDHPDTMPAVMGFRYDERTSELQPIEIAAVQKLYGARKD